MKRFTTPMLLLVLTTACGSRVALEDRPIAAAGRGGIVPAASPAAADRAGVRSPSGAASTRDPETPASKNRDAFFEPKAEGDFALKISVTPTCVTPGSTALASISTKPGVQLALMVSYSDRNKAGPYTFATADATGRYGWTFAVPSGAPMGPSEIIAGAVDWDTRDRATGRTGFTIAERC